MGFLITVLVGLGMGIIIFPIGLWIYLLFKNTKERRMIKKMLKKDQFLITIDPKDYNTNAWSNQKYGNIDIEQGKRDLLTLNKKIFEKSIESTDGSFLLKVLDYVKIARNNGYTDDMIKTEFRNKSYSEELIDKIFEEVENRSI